MATKKAPATTAVAVKKPNTSLVSMKEIQENLRKQTEGLKDRIAPPTGNKIRVTQDKKWILPDGTKTDSNLEVVVLDFVAVNNFYDGPYDKDNIVPPGCYAIGTDPKKMFPASNAPNKQNDNCQDCPMGQWGSDGDGKACKGGRALAVLPANSKEDTPIWVLQPSATAIKPFDAYVSEIARTFQSMPISVVTEVSFNENVTYAQMAFGNPKPNPNLAAHYSRIGEARELLMTERDVSGYEKPAAKPAAKKARR